MTDELPGPEEFSDEQCSDVEFLPDDGWAATETRASLLPGALLGTAVLLVWRFAAVRLLGDGAGETGWVELLVGGVLPTVYVLAYPIWMIRRAGGRVFGGWPGWRRLLIEAGIALLALIGVQILNMLLAMIYTRVYGRGPGIPEQFEELAAGGDLLTFVVMAVLACVWAPIAEELFFRRFLLRALAGRFDLVIAIGLQAFVFAILHDYTGMHLGLIFVLGLTMGVLYAWRKTILTSMMLHMLQNTLAIFILGLFMLLSRFGPTLGVQGEPHADGFKIVEVAPDTPAAEAGLQVGDIITEVEGNPVSDGMTVRLLYWGAGLEDGKAELKVQRGDETIDVEVRPGAAKVK